MRLRSKRSAPSRPGLRCLLEPHRRAGRPLVPEAAGGRPLPQLPRLFGCRPTAFRSRSAARVPGRVDAAARRGRCGRRRRNASRCSCFASAPSGWHSTSARSSRCRAAPDPPRAAPHGPASVGSGQHPRRAATVHLVAGTAGDRSPEADSPLESAPSARSSQRLIVAEHDQNRWVFPVDEVEGVHRVPPASPWRTCRTRWRGARGTILRGTLLPRQQKSRRALGAAIVPGVGEDRPMSQPGGDDFLIDLFREEVRTNCQVLTEGLVALEQGGASPERLEAMMRAAHSIKGAARVVNVQPGVEVSHAMEDCFVRAQKAELTLTSRNRRRPAGVRGHAARKSRKRPGPDSRRGWRATRAKWPILCSASTACSGGRRRKHRRARRLRQTRATTAASPPRTGRRPVLQPSAAAPPDLHGCPRARADRRPVPRPRPRPRPIVAARQNPSATQADEGVVRVTARSLTRLMGLAGESLVESRWLQPFSKSLLQLKHLHAQLAETLEGLDEAVQSERVAGTVRRPVGRCPRAAGRLPRVALRSHRRSSTGACAIPTT